MKKIKIEINDKYYKKVANKFEDSGIEDNDEYL